MEKKQYNMTRKNQADFRALLRGLVSAYLLYLGWKLAFENNDPTFPPVAGIVAGVVLVAGAVAFGVYTWKRYRIDRRDAELTDEELAEADDDGGECL